MDTRSDLIKGSHRRPGRPSHREATIALPMPPSVNRAWVNVPGKGRVMSREYRDWRDIAGWTIKAASLEGVPSPVCVTIRAAVPDRICGLDNILKPLLDALTVFGVIEDDSKAVRIVTEWSAEVENGTVLVGVRQFSAPDVRKRMSGAARRRWEVVRAASRDREMET